jgi:viroplasmin and RNaseH domain-containing protein
MILILVDTFFFYLAESKPFRPQHREYSKDEKKTNSIKFFIWSDSWDKIKSVKRDLERIVETQCHKKTINDFVKVVSSLKNDKVIMKLNLKLPHLQTRSKIQLENHRNRGKMYIS